MSNRFADEVYSSQAEGAELLSPPVGGVSDVVCVSLVYLASTKEAGVNIAARGTDGTDYPLAEVRPDQVPPHC